MGKGHMSCNNSPQRAGHIDSNNLKKIGNEQASILKVSYKPGSGDICL